MPAAAGWTVGVIATLSLLASISPLVRWIIKVPREFVNDYIFNFPDTSFAWAFVLALLAAALAARKRIAWLILVLYMVAAVGWNIGDLITGDETIIEEIGEVIGLAFHVAAIVFLLLARKEFWAKVRRGALFKAAAALVAGMAIGTLVGWGLLELFPGTLAREDRFLYALNRVSAFAGADSEFVLRPSARVRQRAARPVRRAGADGRRDRAVPVAARRERADRRGRIRDPRVCSSCTARTTRSATSPPAATRRWCSRPTAGPPSPTASRSASAWPAATRSATRRRGRRPSRRGWRCARATAGRPA